jgi:hypothetical protein
MDGKISAQLWLKVTNLGYVYTGESTNYQYQLAPCCVCSRLQLHNIEQIGCKTLNVKYYPESPRPCRNIIWNKYVTCHIN